MAVGRHPFHHLEAMPARDQGRWAVVLQVVHRRPVRSPDLVDVSETLGGEEADGRVPTLEQRVQPCRRAMDEELDLGTRADGAIQDFENTCGEVARGRQSFGGGQLAGAPRRRPGL